MDEANYFTSDAASGPSIRESDEASKDRAHAQAGDMQRQPRLQARVRYGRTSTPCWSMAGTRSNAEAMLPAAEALACSHS